MRIAVQIAVQSDVKYADLSTANSTLVRCTLIDKAFRAPTP